MRRLFLSLALTGAALAADIDTRVEHGYADSNGVKIHYASLGKGPLIVMIHGFPDFWYTWRNQMAELFEPISDRRHRHARLQSLRQAQGCRQL